MHLVTKPPNERRKMDIKKQLQQLENSKAKVVLVPREMLLEILRELGKKDVR